MSYRSASFLALDPLCGDGLISDGYCLRLYESYVEWSKAEEACEGLGSELVNITISPDMLSSTQQLMTSRGVREIWISAHSTKKWVWTGKYKLLPFPKVKQLA